MSDLPRRINVKEIVDSRYAPGERPVLWGDRRQGVEVIVDDKGESIALFSDGGQPSPARGWQLVLTDSVSIEDGADSATAHTWTLYGL